MGERGDPIRLSVPAEPNFVSVLRAAASVIAGRAGRLDDARTRLGAAVGVAFFAITDRATPGAFVEVVLSAGPDDAMLTLLVDPAQPPLTHEVLDEVGIDHELSPDGRTLRLWVSD